MVNNGTSSFSLQFSATCLIIGEKILNSSLDFVVNRFFMKMFKTNNMEIVIRTCQEHFRFRLPSDLVASRSKKLESGEFVRLNYRIDFVAYITFFNLPRPATAAATATTTTTATA